MVRTKLSSALLLIALASVLSSCAMPTSVAHNTARLENIKPIVASEETFRTFISNTTTQAFSPGHGTQIEYIAADGRAILAYPGNNDVLVGRWKVETTQQNYMRMCFQYGYNTYNPVTGVGGGNWECGGASSYIFNMGEIYDGDLLSMESAHDLPKKLPKYVNFSVAAAMRATGKGALNAPNKAIVK